MDDAGSRRSNARNQDRSDPVAASSTSAVTIVAKSELRIDEIGWTQEEAADTRTRLRPFDEDWNAPGMDAYDDL